VAEIAAVLCTSHTPFLFTSPEEWMDAAARRRSRGAIRADVPVDDLATNRAKEARAKAAFAVLRTKLESARADVLLVFGDDQGEQFRFENFPAFSVFVGDSFAGYKYSRHVGLPVRGAPRDERPKTPDNWASVRGHPDLSRALMIELVGRGFDIAFSTGLSNPDEGMGHAFMRPSFYVRPEYDIPTVPFAINCYYGPQPTGKRCYELGRAIRSIVEALPRTLRVAVIGSGGLWHTPNAPGAYLDEQFDRAILDALRAGDAKRMAEHFDGRRPWPEPVDDAARDIATGGTGMLGGLGGGTGEVRNWIAAAAVADGRPGTVVDYVPIYSSPVGAAFAYWERP
jgi:catalytic LigB subunit of aromatic ring-opening dioxygenase